MNKKNSIIPALGLELIAFTALVLFMKIENLWISLAIAALAVVLGFVTARNDGLREKITGSLADNDKAALAAGGLLMLAMPLFFLSNPYVIHIFTLAWIYVLATMGLNMQTGSVGMVNFAQGALFGIGAYTSGLLAANLGVSFWIGMPAGILMAGAWGLILGLPTLKTREYHLSLVTIAFAYISYLVILNMRWTGGPNGIPGIPKPWLFGLNLTQGLTIGGLRIPGTVFYYYLTIIFIALGLLVARRINYSWLGLAWNAVREDEIACKCYGININHAKLWSFVIGSMYAGASGVLYAHFIGFMSTESMAFSVGLVFVCMVILGGMDNVYGIIAGTILLVLIPEKFRSFQDFRLLFYGLILIAMLLFRPQGLFPAQIRRYAGLKGGGNE